MTHDRKSEPLAGLLRHTLRGSRPTPECAPPDLLAAYFEGGLSQQEAAGWERHFAACGHCQAQLAALVRIEEAAGVAAGPQPAPGFWFLKLRWLAPALAAAGAVALWVIVQPPAPTTDLAKVVQAPKAPEVPVAKAPADAADASLAARDKPDSPASAPAASPDSASGKKQDVSRAGRDDHPAERDAFAVLDGRTRAFGAMSQLRGSVVAGNRAKAKEGARAEESARKDEKAEVAGTLAQAREQEKNAVVTGELKRQESAKLAAAPPPPQPAGQRPAEQPSTLASTVTVETAPAQGQAGGVQAPPGAQKTRQPEPRRNEAAWQAPTGQELRKEAPPQQTGDAMRDWAAQSQAREAQLAGRGPLTVVAPSRRIRWRFPQAGRIERYDETTMAWEAMESPVKTEILAASAPSEPVCWAVGRGGVILRTTESGTWLRVGSPAEEDMVFVSARDANNATVRTASGKSYSTSDAGRTWRSL